MILFDEIDPQGSNTLRLKQKGKHFTEDILQFRRALTAMVLTKFSWNSLVSVHERLTVTFIIVVWWYSIFLFSDFFLFHNKFKLLHQQICTLWCILVFLSIDMDALSIIWNLIYVYVQIFLLQMTCQLQFI